MLISDLAKELNNDFSAFKGALCKCDLCGVKFRRGEYCFYMLCDACCDEFKWQQYGVFVYETKRGCENFTSSIDWIKFKKENKESKIVENPNIKKGFA